MDTPLQAVPLRPQTQSDGGVQAGRPFCSREASDGGGGAARMLGLLFCCLLCQELLPPATGCGTRRTQIFEDAAQ